MIVLTSHMVAWMFQKPLMLGILSVESFLWNLLRRLIITSTPFSLAVSFSGISKTTSCVPPSRGKSKARPLRFLANSGHIHKILKVPASLYVFNWESAGGVLELVDDIALQLCTYVLINLHLMIIYHSFITCYH